MASATGCDNMLITGIILLLLLYVTVLEADSPAHPEPTRTVSPKCLQIHCNAVPNCHPEQDPLNLCARAIIRNTKECGYPYDSIGQTLYTGYFKVYTEYCSKNQSAQFKKDIDILAKTTCWNDSLFCIAKPLGVDQGVKLNSTVCSQAWDKLENCWKTSNLQWECKQPVKRVAPILFDTIQDCGGAPVVSDATTTSSSTTMAAVTLLLTLLLCRE